MDVAQVKKITIFFVLSVNVTEDVPCGTENVLILQHLVRLPRQLRCLQTNESPK